MSPPNRGHESRERKWRGPAVRVRLRGRNYLTAATKVASVLPMHSRHVAATKPVRVETASPEVVQGRASRMRAPFGPPRGSSAFPGERYRRVAGGAGEEHVIDATIAQARSRSKMERRGWLRVPATSSRGF